MDGSWDGAAAGDAAGVGWALGLVVVWAVFVAGMVVRAFRRPVQGALRGRTYVPGWVGTGVLHAAALFGGLNQDLPAWAWVLASPSCRCRWSSPRSGSIGPWREHDRAVARHRCGGAGSVDPQPHPRHNLDTLLLHGVSVLAVAVPAEKVAFAYVRDALQVSDSVSASSSQPWTRPATSASTRSPTDAAPAPGCRRPEEGRAAFARHRAALAAIADG